MILRKMEECLGLEVFSEFDFVAVLRTSGQDCDFSFFFQVCLDKLLWVVKSSEEQWTLKKKVEKLVQLS